MRVGQTADAVVSAGASRSVWARYRRPIRIALVATMGLALLAFASLWLIVRTHPEWLLFPGWDLPGGVHGSSGR